MTDARLRIADITIQVRLTVDDGDELVAGPPLSPVTLSLSQARAMLDALPAEVERLAAHLAEQAEAEQGETGP